jgi:hypothetical protein
MRIILLLACAVATGAIASLGLQEEARLTYPKYDELAEYYWAGDFKPAAECEDSVSYLKQHAPNSFGMGVRCAYARRFKVWWLMAKNIALVQAPALLSENQ